MVDGKKLDREFKRYMDMYKSDKELGQLMMKLSYQELFNDKFLHENSQFKNLDDMLFRGGFGLTNAMEIEQVNQDKWNEYIAAHTDCRTWHQFGKLAMVDWMKTVIRLVGQVKKKQAEEKKHKGEAGEQAGTNPAAPEK
jgi:hypothetical protein